ncbi:MAG: penicillin-binding protein 2, partial [Eggerthellaceae bacterium]|nr:penicillin-binding protein 2 [Eggerthellaceae bacterium]
PSGSLAAHVVGYYSQIYGTSGLEASYNETLKGSENYATWTDVLNNYAGISTSGNDIQLTIDSRIQQAAEEALLGVNGACVVIDPETGAVLALASSPTYDASDFDAILAAEDESDVLYNRATQALYAPGSTFKMLSLAAALENGIASEDTVYNSPGSMDIGNALVYNYDQNDLGDITLEQATWYSSNTVYGQLGTQIGADLLVRTAEQCGFNDDIDFDLPLTMSLMPDPAQMTEWETAWAAIGQPVGEHSSPAGPQATVLQMAMLGCAVANDGVVQKPYLVDSVYNSNGERATTAVPTPYSTVMSADTARRELTMLEGVVNNGTGTAAAVPGVQIAGKTGTAETGKEIDDSWFVGMGPSDDCKVVVAIVLEEGADRWDDAPARAKNVLSTALEVQGAL